MKDSKDKDNKEVEELQDIIGELLARHRSILDCLTKHHESTSRINRAITKAVTHCGCITVNANRQKFPEAEVGSMKECHKYADSHLEGQLCESCFEVIEEEIGNHLFYLTALCNLLDIDLKQVFSNEFSRLNTLGHYLLS